MIIWKAEDVAEHTATLDDDLVLTIDQDLPAVALSEYDVNQLVEQLSDYTTAATQRALRADHLAAAAEHLRSAGIADFSAGDLLDTAWFLDGKDCW